MTDEPKLKTIFGDMEFATMKIGHDEFPIAIIHKIDAVMKIEGSKVDDMLFEHHFDSYLILDEYEGEIFYPARLMPIFD